MSMTAAKRSWNSILSAFSPAILSQRPSAPIVRMSSTSTAGQQPPAQPPKPIYFGPFDVTNQVFLTTRHSFALVNLKPLLPGHVLVCPLRPHRRLTDLSAAELTDLFTAVQRVQRMLARHYFSPSAPAPTATAVASTTTTTKPTEPTTQEAAEAEPTTQNQEEPCEEPTPEKGSFNIAIQDGPEAGQTVPHVHVHVLPRIRGSTAKPASTPSDAVYEGMAGEEGNVGGGLWDRYFHQHRQHQDHQDQVVRNQSQEHGQDQGQDRNHAGESSGGDVTRRSKEEGGMVVMAERPVPGGSFPSIEDADRMARGMGEMEAEAAVYRGVLEGMGREGL